MRRSPSIYCGLCGLLIASLPVVTRADLSSTFGGTVLLSDSVVMQPDSPGLSATIDYAVFKPGTWDVDKFTSLVNADLFSGSDYLYAYQIRNTGTSSLPIAHSFSADFTGEVHSLGYTPETGVPPVPIASLVGKQFYFFLFPAPINGQSSPILLLTSPNSYEFRSASIINGDYVAKGNIALPDPPAVPAPSAALLVLLGAAFVAAGKNHRLITSRLSTSRC